MYIFEDATDESEVLHRAKILFEWQERRGQKIAAIKPLLDNYVNLTNLP